ncbi:exported hypothetical protein [Micrococcus luteus]|nr:exported hypothetical protein [Micrococcus luteus]
MFDVLWLILAFSGVVVVRLVVALAPAEEATTDPAAAVSAQDPAEEATTDPAAAVSAQDPTPQSKRTRVTLRDTAWATLVAGAFLAGRRQR